MSLLFEPVTDLRQQYRYLTTLLWKNNHYQAAFTISRTPVTEAYECYWYYLPHNSNRKVERLYYLTKEGIFIDYGDNTLYRIYSMEMYLPSTDMQIMLKLQNIENSTDYKDLIGCPIPKKPDPVYHPQKSRKDTIPENPVMVARRQAKKNRYFPLQ